MPTPGPLELVIILVIALLILGPGKLPDVGAALGKSIREFRKASSDVQDAAKVNVVAPDAEEPARPLVIHGVQHVMHPPARLEGWPDADERTRIVLITRDLEPQAVTRLFDAFLDRSAPDRPDRAALTDNPLVPFGGVDR